MFSPPPRGKILSTPLVVWHCDDSVAEAIRLAQYLFSYVFFRPNVHCRAMTLSSSPPAPTGEQCMRTLVGTRLPDHEMEHV